MAIKCPSLDKPTFLFIQGETEVQWCLMLNLVFDFTFSFNIMNDSLIENQYKQYNQIILLL